MSEIQSLLSYFNLNFNIFYIYAFYSIVNWPVIQDSEMGGISKLWKKLDKKHHISSR